MNYNKNRDGQEILDLYDQGENCKQIAAKLKTTEPTVKNVLLQFGIDYKKEYAKKQLLKYEEGLKLYNSGMQFKKICKQLEIGPNSFRPYIKEKTGGLRTQKESLVLNMDNSEKGILKRSDDTRKYSLDETAFDNLEDEKTAYWIGFLHADGTLRKGKNSYCISLVLKEDDFEHIEKFCDFLSTSRDRIFFTHSNKSCGITIGSYRLGKILAELGFNNRKSWDGKPPEKLKSNSNFWRGVIDGDGCLSITKRQYKNETYSRPTVAVCGTFDTVNGFKEFTKLHSNTSNNKLLQVEDDKNFYTLTFGSAEDFKNITHLLYKNSTIFLNRKYQRYLDYIKILEEKELYKNQ